MSSLGLVLSGWSLSPNSIQEFYLENIQWLAFLHLYKYNLLQHTMEANFGRRQTETTVKLQNVPSYWASCKTEHIWSRLHGPGTQMTEAQYFIKLTTTWVLWGVIDVELEFSMLCRIIAYIYLQSHITLFSAHFENLKKIRTSIYFYFLVTQLRTRLLLPVAILKVALIIPDQSHRVAKYQRLYNRYQRNHRQKKSTC